MSSLRRGWTRHTAIPCPPETMKDHLRMLSKGVSNAQALDIEAEPGAVHLVFSDGATATVTVQFCLS